MLARLRFYWVVVACGGVLMALEILASRLLAPHFGNSVYVWGSIISVFLAALSVGYLWGGRMADRSPDLASLARLIALAAACEGGLLAFGHRGVAAFADWTGGRPSGTLFATAVLFGPVSVLLATVSPYAVRLAARDLGRLGHTTGRLYALSNAGSLAGTLGCTFGLIPYLDLRQSLGLLLLVTAATSLVALAGRMAAQKATALLGLLLVAAALPASRLRTRAGTDVIYERVSAYQTLEVREIDGVRFLESDRVRQGGIRLADGRPAVPYIAFAPAALLVRPGMRRALGIGLGAGSLGPYLRRQVPGLAFDYVEIDPAILDVARRYFRFAPGGGLAVTIADGRTFLERSPLQTRWDLIYGDAYIGLSVPFHLTTVEFLDQVKRHLEPGGVFAVNLAQGLADPFSRSIYLTIRQRFPAVYLFAVPGARNVLVLASESTPVLSRAELLARARELDRRFHFDPPLARIAAHWVEVSLPTQGVTVLSDEFAPTDRLIRLGQGGR